MRIYGADRSPRHDLDGLTPAEAIENFRHEANLRYRSFALCLQFTRGNARAARAQVSYLLREEPAGPTHAEWQRELLAWNAVRKCAVRLLGGLMAQERAEARALLVAAE